VTGLASGRAGGGTGLRSALGFLTVVPGAGAPRPLTLAWFPLVGAGVGAAVGGVWALGGAAHWPRLVTGALAAGADLVLTGLLHIDGLADSGDGLIAPMSRERRLEVMARPDIGAFGMAVVGWVLIVRVAALASPRLSVLVLAGLWALSRTLMAGAILVLPYARGEGGLAAAFRPARRRRSLPIAVILGGAGLAAVLAVLGAGPIGLVAVAVAAAAGGGVLALARVRLGGFTGDVLGAAGVVAESAGLVAAALR
jgi:adenosylcobinamide-GDP ribazoletransferase